MGAADFMTVGYGKTANEAFDKANAEARWEHGNGGYTGTIAEKGSFVLFDVPEGLSPMQAANAALWMRPIVEYVDGEWIEIPVTPERVAKDLLNRDADADRVAALAAVIEKHLPALERIKQVAIDKWGPAAAFKLPADDKWLFFGLASE
jgi:hypothetical protein